MDNGSRAHERKFVTPRPPSREEVEHADREESAWVRSYMDLTGASELQARDVFMYVHCRENSAGGPVPAMVSEVHSDPFSVSGALGE